MIELDPEAEREEGAPAWMATFADLMSLLVCFFVLLLSFSEMDVVKYKKIAEAMSEAFGVQSRIAATSIPKGTSVIAREFSPGTPRPTTMEVIRQQTTTDSQHSLRVGSADDEGADGAVLLDRMESATSRPDQANLLAELLKDGVSEGKVEVESTMNQITVRIREQGSFASGKAVLNPELLPLVRRLHVALAEIAGTISVEGHTDDLPITSPVFESNWELSAARAMSVARELMRGGELEKERFMVVGRADTRPIRPNDSPQNRAANRRVEIVVRTEPEQRTDGRVSDMAEAGFVGAGES